MIKEGGAPETEWLTGWFAWLPKWIASRCKALLPVVIILLLMCCNLQLIFACIKKAALKIGGMHLIMEAVVLEDEHNMDKGQIEHTVETQT